MKHHTFVHIDNNRVTARSSDGRTWEDKDLLGLQIILASVPGQSIEIHCADRVLCER